MRKNLGVIGILVFVFVFASLAGERFHSPENIVALVHRTSLFGLISIGAAFVIITGGIDLSIGSLIGLTGCLFVWMTYPDNQPPGKFEGLEWPVIPAVLMTLGIATLIGFVHGILVTRLRLQPFIVTLCGLLLYRGLARGLSGDHSPGIPESCDTLRASIVGRTDIGDPLSPEWFGWQLPHSFLVMIAVALMASVLFRRTTWGRYLFALGRNEEAARFSGVPTGRMTVMAYMVCSFLAGIAGIMFFLESESLSATSLGQFYELYAIAGAVLGGCALRGGTGGVFGVIIGASIMVVIITAIRYVPFIPNQLEFAVVGAVILAGVIIDEIVKRLVSSRRS